MQLRSERDADRIEIPQHYMDVRSHTHAHEVPCGSCGRMYFADNEAYESLMRAMEFDPDNLFMCDECQIDNDELEHLH